MNANDYFKSGDLTKAIEAQTQAVKAAPGDQGVRLFLFELLAFAGDLDRAQKHIDIIHYDDLAVEAGVDAYRRLLDAERKRRDFFAKSTPPSFFAEFPEHVNLRIQALLELRSGRPADAAATFAKADEQAPLIKGTCNDKPFEGMRDGDDRFGPILEVMARGSYYWVPWDQIAALEMKAPKFPRDLIWMPAHLEMKDAAGDVFLPTRYPGSENSKDTEIQLGRKTDWQGDGGPTIGLGTKTYLVGEDGMSILEWRKVAVGG